MNDSVKHYRVGADYLGGFVDGAKPEHLEAFECPPPDNVGQKWDGTGWGAEPVAAPQKVTMRQARLALHAEGLLAQVELAIDALPEPTRTAARIEWDYTSEVHRASEFVILLGAALELDKQSLDDLFLKAREL